MHEQTGIVLVPIVAGYSPLCRSLSNSIELRPMDALAEYIGRDVITWNPIIVPRLTIQRRSSGAKEDPSSEAVGWRRNGVN